MAEAEVVPFNKKDVKEYLDQVIEYWRKKRSWAEKRGDQAQYEQATHYVDAFQSVRVSLFGELKD